jgi:LysM repeat protein
MVSNVNVKENSYKDDYSVVVYFIKPGDTLWDIAKKFRVTVDSLIRINDLENPDIIYPGEKLYIVK